MEHMQRCPAFRNIHPETGSAPGPTDNGASMSPIFTSRGQPTAASAASSNTTTADTSTTAARSKGPDPTVADVEAMSVGQLKALLRERNISFVGCVEKSELRDRARQALG